jgi:hypothetical protein
MAGALPAGCSREGPHDAACSHCPLHVGIEETAVNRSAPPVRESADWLDVSVQRPCPVCSGTHGCSVGLSGEFVGCLRCPSDHPLISGGWLHALAVRLTTSGRPRMRRVARQVATLSEKRRGRCRCSRLALPPFVTKEGREPDHADPQRSARPRKSEFTSHHGVRSARAWPGSRPRRRPVQAGR